MWVVLTDDFDVFFSVGFPLSSCQNGTFFIWLISVLVTKLVFLGIFKP